MATRIQFRRGTSAQHASFTGAVGEMTVDTDKDVVVVHDGSTAGGFEMLRSNLSNINIGGTETANYAIKADGDGTYSWGLAGGVLQIKKAHYSIFNYVQSTSYVSFGLDISITPVSADSSFYINAWVNMSPYNHDSNAVLNIHDSALGSSMNTTSQHCFQYNPVDYYSNAVNMGYMNQWSTGSTNTVDDYRSDMTNVSGLYTPASASSSTRTFKTVMRTHQTTAANGYYINRGFQDHPHQSVGTSHIIVWELANEIVS